jgi:alpha-galactosidase
MNMNPSKPHSHATTIRHALGLLCLAVLSSLAVPSAARASDLTGTWRMDQHKKSGVTIHSFLVLRQSGSHIEGSVFANGADELQIKGGHMEGEVAVFSVDWGWAFRVSHDGQNLHVVVTYGGSGTEEATAYPVPDNATQAPPTLPPPAVRTLPYNGLAKTPPMGWNSWNHFAETVDDRIVRETADAMAKNGMAAAGYGYVNIDDTWEEGRDAQGNIVANGKFPDMKALADYVHSRGLKLGIYSSPGYLTCGGYEGSYGHEEQDAKTYASWGIDYLKYDWCSAGRNYHISDLRPIYQKMGEALQRCGRPIFYSLCEYGMGGVWTWGPSVGANLWRTTGDIQDNWNSMSNIGFNQGRLAPYAAPGHWNDPDMLEVGNGGMSATEYRTHFSLWCMLAAPLMAGNDLRTMSGETRDILTNREVISVDQDPLGKQGTRAWEGGGIEIWTKPLENGGVAVGVFNRNSDERTASFPWTRIGLTSKPSSARDLWQHSDLDPVEAGYSGKVPGHGVVMLILR